MLAGGPKRKAWGGGNPFLLKRRYGNLGLESSMRVPFQFLSPYLPLLYPIQVPLTEVH